MRKIIGLSLVMASSGLLSCGGDDDGGTIGSCSAFMACGGNVVGDWAIQKVCADTSNAMGYEGCPQATADLSGVQISGTISVKSDMTYTSMITMAGSLSTTIPQSCLLNPNA